VGVNFGVQILAGNSPLAMYMEEIQETFKVVISLKHGHGLPLKVRGYFPWKSAVGQLFLYDNAHMVFTKLLEIAHTHMVA